MSKETKETKEKLDSLCFELGKKIISQELINQIPELLELSNEYSNIKAKIEVYGFEWYRKEFGIDIKYTKEIPNAFVVIDVTLKDYVKMAKDYEKFKKWVVCKKDILNYLVRDRGITNNELSNAVGVSPSSVGRWLSGETNITSENLEKVAKYFNVPLSFLNGESRFIKTDLNKEVPEMSDNIKKWLIDETKKHAFSNLNKETLKQCGYLLLDPYEYSAFYDKELLEVPIYECQKINEEMWINWDFSIKYFEGFPQKVALIKIEDLETSMAINLEFNNPLEYSETEEIKKIAQYVDYDKLKLLLEDRKNLLAFNFEKSLESIK